MKAADLDALLTSGWGIRLHALAYPIARSYRGAEEERDAEYQKMHQPCHCLPQVHQDLHPLWKVFPAGIPAERNPNLTAPTSECEITGLPVPV